MNCCYISVEVPKTQTQDPVKSPKTNYLPLELPDALFQNFDDNFDIDIAQIKSMSKMSVSMDSVGCGGGGGGSVGVGVSKSPPAPSQSHSPKNGGNLNCGGGFQIPIPPFGEIIMGRLHAEILDIANIAVACHQNHHSNLKHKDFHTCFGHKINNVNMRKVQFNDPELVQILEFEDDEDSKKTRGLYWEFFALDRCRFRDRVQRTGEVLTPIFSRQHRDKVYRERILPYLDLDPPTEKSDPDQSQSAHLQTCSITSTTSRPSRSTATITTTTSKPNRRKVRARGIGIEVCHVDVTVILPLPVSSSSLSSSSCSSTSSLSSSPATSTSGAGAGAGAGTGGQNPNKSQPQTSSGSSSSRKRNRRRNRRRKS